MNSKLADKVSFGFVRYANCWEDADVLLKGLSPRSGGKVLSIGSAGDNSFSLLSADSDLVLASDISEIQLFLIELKKVCFKELAYEELLAFVGVEESNSRAAVFHKMKHQLSAGSRSYWENNISAIEAGIIFRGKFEKYFQVFRKKVLPFIHSKNKIAVLLKEKTDADQKMFYEKHWNTFLWKCFLKLFFSRLFMGRLGRDPEFLKQVKIPVSEYIYQKSEAHLSSALATQNYFLHFIFCGCFGNNLPHYLRKENFESIRSNLSNLKLECGYAEKLGKKYGRFDSLNLSNVFEYMDEIQFAEAAADFIALMANDGKMAYWNLMVPRQVSMVYPAAMRVDSAVSIKLSQVDKGFFYNKFLIETLQ